MNKIYLIVIGGLTIIAFLFYSHSSPEIFSDNENSAPKEIIDNSGLNVLSAIGFDEAAKKVQSAIKWQHVINFFVFYDKKS